MDALTDAHVMGYLDRYPLDNFTVVTLGPAPLVVPD